MIPGLPNELLVLLAGLCLLPALFVAILVCLPRTAKPVDKMVSGNPLFDNRMLPVKQDVFLLPLVHAMRAAGSGQLKDLVLGLRHLPIHKTAPVLQSALQRRSPELQTYAQSILQQKQEELQADFVRLKPPAGGPVSGAMPANYMEAGIKLASSPLTQSSEQCRILEMMLPVVESVAASTDDHPRLVAACIQACLRLDKGDWAQSLLQRLPEGSPLMLQHQSLLAHYLAVHHPPEPVTSRYEIR